jgi:hypothetical protein
VIFGPATPQVFGVALRGTAPVQRNGLLGDKSARPVRPGGVNVTCALIAFGAGHERGARLMHFEDASKVQAAAVPDLMRTKPQNQQVSICLEQYRDHPSRRKSTFSHGLLVGWEPALLETIRPERSGKSRQSITHYSNLLELILHDRSP